MLSDAYYLHWYMHHYPLPPHHTMPTFSHPCHHYCGAYCLVQCLNGGVNRTFGLVIKGVAKPLPLKDKNKLFKHYFM